MVKRNDVRRMGIPSNLQLIMSIQIAIRQPAGRNTVGWNAQKPLTKPAATLYTMLERWARYLDWHAVEGGFHGNNVKEK